MSLMPGLPDLSLGPQETMLFHRKGVVTMYVFAFRFAWKWLEHDKTLRVPVPDSPECNNKNLWNVFFFFKPKKIVFHVVVNFWSVVTQEKCDPKKKKILNVVQLVQTSFSCEKWASSRHILKKQKVWISPSLDYRFQQVAKSRQE
jgi:hypothetical protein